MAILGPYPDGGYELWCNECGVKITCFSIAEMFGDKEDFDLQKNIEKFKDYDNFYCSDCLPILKDKKKSFDKEAFLKYLKEWLLLIYNTD
jgi:hypothetical protein